MKRIFCAKIYNFLFEKIVHINKKEKKLFAATEWLKKLCAGLPKWQPLVEK